MGVIAYGVKLRNPSAHKQTLAVAHGVLAAAEHVGCAHRIMSRYMKFAPRPGDKAVIWNQYFAAAGGVAELRARLLRYKPCEVVAREYLTEHKPALVAVLDRVVARQVRGDLPLQMCCFAQTHFWSHWNESVSMDFIESMAFDGTDSPVIATVEDHRSASTGSPWVKEAWMRQWRTQFKLSEPELKKVMAEIKVLCHDAAKMGRYAALGMIVSCGAGLERQERKPKVVTTTRRKRTRSEPGVETESLHETIEKSGRAGRADYSSGVRPGMATAATGNGPSS